MALFTCLKGRIARVRLVSRVYGEQTFQLKRFGGSCRNRRKHFHNHSIQHQLAAGRSVIITEPVSYYRRSTFTLYKASYKRFYGEFSSWLVLFWWWLNLSNYYDFSKWWYHTFYLITYIIIKSLTVSYMIGCCQNWTLAVLLDEKYLS